MPRAAFSRNFDANSDVLGSPATRSSSTSSGSGTRSSVATSSIDSGSRKMMPSSLHSTCTGRSARASRSSMTRAHGACTREPNGVRMQTRQSPISSGKRSITTVRSSGIAPVDSACSSRYMRRFDAARASRPDSRSAASAPGPSSARSSRTSPPRARPSSNGRPGRSPRQNGVFAGCPGAGVTTTRSTVISSIRHVDAPSTKHSPTRLS